MPINMSHCRFENALKALREFDEALASLGINPLDALNDNELKYAEKTIRLCHLIAENYYEGE